MMTVQVKSSMGNPNLMLFHFQIDHLTQKSSNSFFDSSFSPKFHSYHYNHHHHYHLRHFQQSKSSFFSQSNRFLGMGSRSNPTWITGIPSIRGKRSAEDAVYRSVQRAFDSGEEEKESEFTNRYSKMGNSRNTRQRSKKNELMLAANESYRIRYLKMLKEEYNEEVNMITNRILRCSAGELEEEGVALFNLSVKMRGWFFGKRVLELVVLNGSGILPSHHQFSKGDIVCISEGNPLGDDDPIEGVVLKKARRFLQIVVPGNVLLDPTLKYRLDLYFNGVSYERCSLAMECLSSIRKGKDGSGTIKFSQWKGKKNDSVLTTKIPNEESEIAVGDGLLAIKHFMDGLECIYLSKSEGTTEAFSFQQFLLNEDSKYDKGKNRSILNRGDNFYDGSREESQKILESNLDSKSKAWTGNKIFDLNSLDLNDDLARYGKESIENGFQLAKKQNKNNELRVFKKKVTDFLEKSPRDLNASQKEAIVAASSRFLTLWKGPPGTGKTKTLLSFMEMMKYLNQGQILACADSNVAVDNMVEGLLKMGIRVIRIGQPAKVKEDLLQCTLEYQLQQHPLFLKSNKMKEDSAEIRAKGRKMNNKEKRKDNAQKSTALFDQSDKLMEKAVNDILDKADVIASTCVSAGDPILGRRKFSSCVIDECTQATLPTCMIPLLNCKSDCIVLVGDNNQLPPTVISEPANKDGLGISLFEILYSIGVDCFLLNTQYRMHPSIAKFPSLHFYDNKLLSAVKPEQRIPCVGFDWRDNNHPMVFINCKNGIEECSKNGNSFYNTAEANLVLGIMKRLLLEGDLEGDLEGRCESIGIITPYRAQVRTLTDLFLKHPIQGLNLEKLEIRTVDGFQGREKEVIIFSTVRSNPHGELGFVSDRRRMNVGLTRAKRGLIVLGFLPTLNHNPDWKAWIQHMQKKNLCIDA